MNHKIIACALTGLVEDPLIGLVMTSDGVDRQSIETLFEPVANSARYREAVPCPDY
jgi:hypothetical protein